MPESTADGQLGSEVPLYFVEYPHAFPCRINEHSRATHCRSCEIVPDLLAEIARLRSRLVLFDRMGESR